MSFESALVTLPILILSAVFHEYMHGWVANKLGDPTARLLGRLTLNPIPHIDPINSIFLPAVLIFSGSPIIFGAAKPVPVNPLHFSDPKKDMALTALAGPCANIALAISASLFFNIFWDKSSFTGLVLFSIVFYNLLLGILNLIPIPPLDGSKVLASFLPNKLAYSYLSVGQFGIFILLFFLLVPIGGFDLSQVLKYFVDYSLSILGIQAVL